MATKDETDKAGKPETGRAGEQESKAAHAASGAAGKLEKETRHTAPPHKEKEEATRQTAHKPAAAEKEAVAEKSNQQPTAPADPWENNTPQIVLDIYSGLQEIGGAVQSAHADLHVVHGELQGVYSEVQAARADSQTIYSEVERMRSGVHDIHEDVGEVNKHVWLAVTEIASMRNELKELRALVQASAQNTTGGAGGSTTSPSTPAGAGSTGTSPTPAPGPTTGSPAPQAGGAPGSTPPSIPQLFIEQVSKPNQDVTQEVLAGTYVTQADVAVLKADWEAALQKTLDAVKQTPALRTNQNVVQLFGLRQSLPDRLKTQVTQASSVSRGFTPARR